MTVSVTPRASYGHSEQQGSANQNRITLTIRISAFNTYTLNILGAVHARSTGKGCTRPRFFSDQGKRRDCPTKPALAASGLTAAVHRTGFLPELHPHPRKTTQCDPKTTGTWHTSRRICVGGALKLKFQNAQKPAVGRFGEKGAGFPPSHTYKILLAKLQGAQRKSGV
jgi:hypothetical protein